MSAGVNFAPASTRFQPRTDVIGQRVSGDIVRLHERGIKKITQRDGVTRLKADVVFRGPLKRLRWNGHRFIEIAGFLF